ncbi:hypothetical protein [Sphingomonas oryzagri]
MATRIAPLLLLFGALLGLFGQQAAYALGPGIVKVAATEHRAQQPMPGMSGMECEQMMMAAGQPAHHDGSKPCKDMSLACIAAMGCTIPIVLGGDPVPAMAKTLLLPLAFWSTTPHLIGRSYGPEPEPPAHLS